MACSLSGAPYANDREISHYSAMNGNPNEVPSLEADRLEPHDSNSTRWLIFFIALLGPAVLTTGTLKTASNFAAIAMFAGSPIAGIICAAAVPLSDRHGQAARWAMRISLALVLTVLSFILCFAGCLFGMN